MLHHKRKKRFFLIILGICLVVLYLQLGLFPGDLKKVALRELRAQTRQNFYFTKALYIPFYGLSLYDFRLKDSSGALIFSCRKFTVNVRLIPFFREKKVIISNVHLDNPVYEYILDEAKQEPKEAPKKTRMSGQIEIPGIQNKKAADLSAVEDGPNAFLPENVYLEQIQIHNGNVTIKKTAQSPILEKLSSINLRMGFKSPPKLFFDGSFDIGEKTYSSLQLKGIWNLATSQYQFILDCQSKKIPDWLLEYQRDKFLRLTDGRFQVNIAIKSVEERRILFHAKALLGNSLIKIKSADYKGRMGLDAVGRFNFENKVFEAYKGTLELKNITIENLTEQIQRLDEIKGNVDFIPDHLTLENIEGDYKNVHFSADGSIESFKDLRVDVAIRTQSDLEKILSLVPDEQKKFIADFSIDGHCRALTTVKGTLKNAASIIFEHKLLLENGSMKSHDGKISLENISSEIFSNANGIQIKNCKLQSEDKNYSVNAFFPKDKQKSGDLSLASKDFSLKARYKALDEAVKIETADLKMQGVSITFDGILKNLKEPYLDVRGKVRANLNKALSRFDFPLLKKWPLRGDMDGSFALSGYWKKPLDWNLSLGAKADTVFIQDKIRLDRLEMQAKMNNRLLSIPYLHANGYGGNIGSSFVVDLRQEHPYFTNKTYVNNVDVRALCRALAIKKDVSGTGVLQFNLGGFSNAPESIQGNGVIDIHGGKIFETDQFKAMGSLPLVKVEGLTMVTFTNLTSNFVIHHKRLWTDNLALKSVPVDLSVQGSIGFDQTLDMEMGIQFSNSIIEGAFDTGGIVPFVVQQAGNFISHYKISGTLGAPKTDKIPASAGKSLSKGLGGLIQSVVQ